MRVKVDVRGYPRPTPVMLTERAIIRGNFPIEVLADNEEARENVLRIALRYSLKISEEIVGNEFHLTLDKEIETV